MSQPRHCSFCGKHEDEVKTLIAAPPTYICNVCVTTCVLVLVKANQGEGFVLELINSITQTAIAAAEAATSESAQPPSET